MVTSDPRFYVRLGAWYSDHGDVRDHKEMFAVTLILSDFPGHRDVGLAMLRELPPYQVVRVLDFIHGRKTTRKVREKSDASTTARSARRGRAPRRGEPDRPRSRPDRVESSADRFETTRLPVGSARTAGVRTTTESFGLFKNPP